MLELEYWLLEAVRSDSAFFRSMGIAPCVIDGPFPEALLLPSAGGSYIRLTEKDALWLKALGVAWEPEPEFQLPLEFCERPVPSSSKKGRGRAR